MLQEFLRHGQTKGADNPDSNVREGSSAELGICSQPVWVSAYCGKSSKRPPWKWWIFRWIFAVEFLVTKYKRKIRRKNPPENPPAKCKKIRRRTTPPKSTSQAQLKSAAKPTNKSACQTSKYTPGFFSIEKVCSWRRLQSMDSGTLFGCLLGMVEAPMLKCTCNPSAAAGGRDKVCCAPFQTTLLVKSVRMKYGNGRPQARVVRKLQEGGDNKGVI